MRYSRRQISPLRWLVALPLSLVAVALAVTGFDSPGVVVASGVAVGLAIVAFIMSSITVEVDDVAVRVAFGAGWPQRSVPLTRITDVRTMRNAWWHGWGIRWIPGGSLWNVWGLDAVELTLDSGKLWRVGTDDPTGLLAAIRHAMVG